MRCLFCDSCREQWADTAYGISNKMFVTALLKVTERALLGRFSECLGFCPHHLFAVLPMHLDGKVFGSCSPGGGRGTVFALMFCPGFMSEVQTCALKET